MIINIIIIIKRSIFKEGYRYMDKLRPSTYLFMIANTILNSLFLPYNFGALKQIV